MKSIEEIIALGTPINEESFHYFCELLIEAGKLFNFEDSAHSQIIIKTGEPTFTQEEAEDLEDYIEQVFKLIEDPMQIALDVMEDEQKRQEMGKCKRQTT